MKQLPTACLVLATLLGAAKCQMPFSSADEEVQQVASAYLDAVIAHDVEREYEFVHPSDQKAKSLGAYRSESDEVWNTSLGVRMIEASDFAIDSVFVAGDSASAYATLTVPDQEIIMNVLVGSVFSGTFKEKPDSANAAKPFEGKEIPTKKENRVIQLRKSDEGWQIDTEWAEGRAYVADVELTGVQARKSLGTVFSGPKVLVRGQIQNNGARVLSRVKLIVKYLTEEGNSIRENDCTGLSVGVASNDKPLKPGASSSFTCSTTEVSMDWDGEVDVQVESVEFSS